MKKLISFLQAVTVVGALALSSITASAQEKHTLKATYLNTCASAGCPLVSIPANGFWQSIGSPTEINCPAPTGQTCTVIADQFLQIGHSTNGGGALELCPVLDDVGGQCFGDNGRVPGDGSFTAMFVSLPLYDWSKGTWTIPPGNHSVQEMVYTTVPAGYLSYTFTYNVYIP
jgi:hypothetical protein